MLPEPFAVVARDEGGDLALGVGALLAVNFVPDGLEDEYGGNNPIGAMGFLRLKIE